MNNNIKPFVKNALDEAGIFIDSEKKPSKEEIREKQN